MTDPQTTDPDLIGRRLDGSRDRPTSEPGGCECMRCGCIFIGAEWHTLCRVCVEETAAEIAKVQNV